MRKVIRRRVRTSRDGIDIVGDVHAVIASGSSEPGSTVRSSSRSRVKVVQGPNGSKVVEESDVDPDEDDEDEGGEQPR